VFKNLKNPLKLDKVSVAVEPSERRVPLKENKTGECCVGFLPKSFLKSELCLFKSHGHGGV